MIRRLAPLGVAAFLVACGGSAETTADPPVDSTPVESTRVTDGAERAADEATGTPEPAAEPAAFVPEALQFSAPLVGGGEIEMDALAGRPVLLWFWAPW